MFNPFKGKAFDEELLEAAQANPVVDDNDIIIPLGTPIGACLMLTCKGCNKINDDGCSAYKDVLALMWHRHDKPCPMNPPEAESKKKAKINPLKASKRNAR
jgi:hypothetical protein